MSYNRSFIGLLHFVVYEELDLSRGESICMTAKMGKKEDLEERESR